MSDEQELMSLEDLKDAERFGVMQKDYIRIIKTARAAHALKAELEEVKLSRNVWVHDSAQAVKESDELNAEIAKLRAVYKTALRVLRYYGVDAETYIESVNKLDATCEVVKLLDAGNGKDDNRS